MKTFKILTQKHNENLDTASIVVHSASGQINPYIDIIDKFEVYGPVYSLNIELGAEDLFEDICRAITDLGMQQLTIVGWSFAGVIAYHLATLLSHKIQTRVIVIDSVQLLCEIIDSNVNAKSKEEITKLFLLEAKQNLPSQYVQEDFSTIDDLVRFLCNGRDDFESKAINDYIVKSYQIYLKNLTFIYQQKLSFRAEAIHVIGNQTYEEELSRLEKITNIKPHYYKVSADHFAMMKHPELMKIIEIIAKNKIEQGIN